MKMATHIWEQHVAAARQQKISTAAYAKKHGLAVSALYYWQRKSRSVANERSAADAIKPAKHASKFVALRVTNTAPAAAQHPFNCALIFASGMRLEMSALPDPQWLAALGGLTQGAR